MVEIKANTETGKLEISMYRVENFQDMVETLKYSGCRWNPNTKVWEKPIVDFEAIEKEIVYAGEPVEVSELDKKKIREYKTSMIELEHATTRRLLKFDDLMHFRPLPGKPPYEDFQRQDLSRAINQNRFLFNWEMGLGKSYALAALIEHLRFYQLINKCIIFSTGVGVYNLKDELVKFGKNIRADDIFVVNSMDNFKDYDDRDLFNPEKYPQTILIMTYDTFKGISNYYYDKAKGTKSNPKPSAKTAYKQSYIPLKEWLGGYFGALFLDECHSLANPKSRRSEIIDMNLTYFKYRYLFTGTLADKYEKLYEPLYILDRSIVSGKGYTDWLGDYCELGNKWSRYAVNDNGWDLEKIKQLNATLLNGYGAKRKMDECLDLPEQYEVPTINIDMNAPQREIYEAFVKEELRLSQERKRTGEATVKDSVTSMFQIFQLAVDNPSCILNSPSYEKFAPELQNKIAKFKYAKDSKKVEALHAILDEEVLEQGNRGIIWYYHPLTKDELVKELKKYNPIVIEAGMDRESMNAQINEFKSNPEHKVIIGSINIMNTSVTLTEAKFMVYMERTYNYTIWSQSLGRTHRPGQKQVTRIYTLSYKNSIDNLQLENLHSKGVLMNGLLNKNYIDKETWKKIFNYNEGEGL